MISGLVNEPGPVIFAEFVTHMVAKEGTYALRSEISDSVGSAPSQYHWISNAYHITVLAAL